MALLQISGALASNDLDVAISSVTIDGIEVTSGNQNIVIGQLAGETIPLEIVFHSDTNASDARIKAWIAGYRTDIAQSTKRMNLIDGSTYSELLSLRLPSDTEPSEEYTLYVRIETKTESYENSYHLNLQRDSYKLSILDVDASKTVNVGSNLAINVVLKNIGYENLDDTFVIASIAELGVEKKAYFEDLLSLDDEDRRDSAERQLFLRIPENTKTGIYELSVRAYNSDVSETQKLTIAVVGVEENTKVIAPIQSKEIAAGQTGEYDLIVVNSGSKVGIYTVVPEAAEGVIVSVQNPMITVPAGQTGTVKVSVKGVTEGTHLFSVNVNSDEAPVTKVTFSAVVAKKAFTGNVAILTVILAITFVVLLVVLIVLLTRKPRKTDELEESYY
ncbi:hypothetical protein HYW76_05130 [Candidatus Pacearchaeota archaeon]|nr:hypothetical protein [Candidatus Pacearchaeota archaeon]